LRVTRTEDSARGHRAASQELSRLTANIQDSQMLKAGGEIRDGSTDSIEVVNNLLDMNRLEAE
jgi:hypothetical protein